MRMRRKSVDIRLRSAASDAIVDSMPVLRLPRGSVCAKEIKVHEVDVLERTVRYQASSGKEGKVARFNRWSSSSRRHLSSILWPAMETESAYHIKSLFLQGSYRACIATAASSAQGDLSSQLYASRKLCET